MPLEDDFGDIVSTVRTGRRIFDNLRKAMGFVLAVHLPIAGLAFLPLALGLSPPLGPVHIAFFELVVDPVCSLAFEAEPEEGDVIPPSISLDLRPPQACLRHDVARSQAGGCRRRRLRAEMCRHVRTPV